MAVTLYFRSDTHVVNKAGGAYQSKVSNSASYYESGDLLGGVWYRGESNPYLRYSVYECESNGTLTPIKKSDNSDALNVTGSFTAAARTLAAGSSIVVLVEVVAGGSSIVWSRYFETIANIGNIEVGTWSFTFYSAYEAGDSEGYVPDTFVVFHGGTPYSASMSAPIAADISLSFASSNHTATNGALRPVFHSAWAVFSAWQPDDTYRSGNKIRIRTYQSGGFEVIDKVYFTDGLQHSLEDIVTNGILKSTWQGTIANGGYHDIDLEFVPGETIVFPALVRTLADGSQKVGYNSYVNPVTDSIAPDSALPAGEWMFEGRTIQELSRSWWTRTGAVYRGENNCVESRHFMPRLPDMWPEATPGTVGPGQHAQPGRYPWFCGQTGFAMDKDQPWSITFKFYDFGEEPNAGGSTDSGIYFYASEGFYARTDFNQGAIFSSDTFRVGFNSAQPSGQYPWAASGPTYIKYTWDPATQKFAAYGSTDETNWTKFHEGAANSPNTVHEFPCHRMGWADWGNRIITRFADMKVNYGDPYVASFCTNRSAGMEQQFVTVSSSNIKVRAGADGPGQWYTEPNGPYSGIVKTCKIKKTQDKAFKRLRTYGDYGHSSPLFQIVDENDNLIPDAMLPGNSSGFRYVQWDIEYDIDLSGIYGYDAIKAKVTFDGNTQAFSYIDVYYGNPGPIPFTGATPTHWQSSGLFESPSVADPTNVQAAMSGDDISVTWEHDAATTFEVQRSVDGGPWEAVT